MKPGPRGRVFLFDERGVQPSPLDFAADQRISARKTRGRREAAPGKDMNNRGRTMSTFDKREESFEKSFVHEEELHFRAEARRNKLLGLWAAQKLGKTD